MCACERGRDLDSTRKVVMVDAYCHIYATHIHTQIGQHKYRERVLSNRTPHRISEESSTYELEGKLSKKIYKQPSQQRTSMHCRQDRSRKTLRSAFARGHEA